MPPRDPWHAPLSLFARTLSLADGRDAKYDCEGDKE
jgi:hypothetical protein